MTCTLGEVKNRADFIIYWGGNPAECHPRHFTKYTLTQKGKFVPQGRKGRYMVLVDIRETPSARAADLFLQIRPGADFEVVTTLIALVKGRRVNRAAVGGVTGTVGGRAQQWMTETHPRAELDHPGAERVLVQEPADLGTAPLEVVARLLRQLARLLADVVHQLAGLLAGVTGHLAHAVARVRDRGPDPVHRAVAGPAVPLGGLPRAAATPDVLGVVAAVEAAGAVLVRGAVPAATAARVAAQCRVSWSAAPVNGTSCASTSRPAR